jgi:uncharacterized protein (UPF0333 family)
MRGRTIARSRGQASLEALAAVPLVVLAALLAWQLVAVVRAGVTAQQRARAAALGASGAAGQTVTASVRVRVPAFLPGLDGLAVGARAAVRTP